MQQQDDTAAPATKKDLRQLEQTMNAQFGKIDAQFGEVNAQFMEVFKYMDRRFEEMKQYMDQKQTETFQHVEVLLETQKHDIISSTNDKISLLDDRVKRLEVHTGLVAA